MKDSTPRNMQDEELMDIILQTLYRIPDFLSIQNNILIPMNIKAGMGQIMMIRKRLVVQDLIIEKDPESSTSLIRITSKGYKVIRDFDTYKAYDKEQKKIAMSERRVQYLEERNIRLKNLNIITGIISFIIGSISGILLSAPLKNILRQWLEDH